MLVGGPGGRVFHGGVPPLVSPARVTHALLSKATVRGSTRAISSMASAMAASMRARSSAVRRGRAQACTSHASSAWRHSSAAIERIARRSSASDDAAPPRGR